MYNIGVKNKKEFKEMKKFTVYGLTVFTRRYAAIKFYAKNADDAMRQATERGYFEQIIGARED